jgi:thiol-disulfide isomerase/thioredoxin
MTIARLARIGVVAVGLLAIAVWVLYATNRAPVVAPLSDDDARASDRPFVVKLHAQWCPSCMVTKDVWAEVHEAYAGRARLVVFDFTNDGTTAAAAAEARRLGLERMFDEYAGATGFVVVLDGRTREVRDEVGGRDFDPYRAAIDAAIAATQ